MNKQKKMKVRPNRLNGTFVRNTFDEESRTIDVVFATEEPVKRFSFFDGEYLEKLSLKKSHVRLDRMKKGAPVLNNHKNRDLNDILGVVESASIKNAQGLATVRFSSREDISGLIKDIADGIIPNISVGYKVHHLREEKVKDGEMPLFLADDWEPMEISFVTIPADASAQARNENNQEDFEEIQVEEQEKAMTKKKKAANKNRSEDVSTNEEASTEEVVVPSDVEGDAKTEEETSSDETSEDAAESTEQDATEQDEQSSEESESEDDKSSEGERSESDISVRANERLRIKEIEALCEKHDLSTEFASTCIDGEFSLEKTRGLVLEELESKSETTRTFNHKLEVGDVDNVKLRNEARVRSMLNRQDSEKYALKDGDRHYAGASLINMAREYLQTEHNVKNTLMMSDIDVAKRALHHSSDFPLLLANTGNKSMQDGYASTPSTFEPFTKSVTRKDFKEGSSIKISDGGKLEKVNEHGEYKRAGIVESGEKYVMEKFGKIVGKTWELMVNDDLDAFVGIPNKLGRRAKEKENELMWALINSNGGLGQTMAETGQTLINANHGNQGAGAAISIDSLGKGREAMRLHVDLDGELIGGLAPKFIYVPAALETIADQFVSQVTPDENGKVNPFANRLQVIVEPRLDAVSKTAWWLMAGKDMVDMAEIARLGGAGPEFFTREGFDVDGMEVKIRYVFGVRLLDYRGFFRNAGV